MPQRSSSHIRIQAALPLGIFAIEASNRRWHHALARGRSQDPWIGRTALVLGNARSLERARLTIDMSQSSLMDTRRPGAPNVPLGRLCRIGFTTFIIRTYKDIVSNFLFTIAPTAVSTALYFIVFGILIGDRIGNVGGLHYEQYLVPGLIVLPIITDSYGQAGLSFVVAKLYRQIDEHLVSPQPSWMIVLSYVAAEHCAGLSRA